MAGKSAQKDIPDREEKTSCGGVPVDICQMKGERDGQQDTYFVGESRISKTEDPERRLQAVFAKIESAIKKARIRKDCGTTVTTVLVCGDELVCANLGDSPAYLFARNKVTGKTETIVLSEEHVAGNENEQRYYATQMRRDITESGPDSEHLKPSQLTRTFEVRKSDLSTQPSIKKVSLKSWLDNPDIELSLLVATDGVVPEGPSVETGAHMYTECLGNWHEKDPHFPQKNIAQRIGAHAIKNVSDDNITVLYAVIPPGNRQNLLLAVCDGHGEKGEKAAEVARDAIVRELGKNRGPESPG